MGRVAKYKKVKKHDPFAKGKRTPGGGGGGQIAAYVWGTGDNGRKEKKRSLKAQRHQARKLAKSSEGRRRAREAAGAGGFDLPPSGSDEFDLADIVGSLNAAKRPRLDDGLIDRHRSAAATAISSKAPISNASKKSTTTTGNNGGEDKKILESSSDIAGDITQAVPDNLAEERRAARILNIKLDASTSASSDVAPRNTKQKHSAPKITGRREGESMRAFERRVKEETRLILLEQAQGSKITSKEKIQRKKDFLKTLKSKKKRKKGGLGKRYAAGSDDEHGNESDTGDASFLTGERAIGAVAARANAGGVSIHNQVERPPSFEFVPRGATRRKTENDDYDRRGGGMDRKKIKAEQRAMDNLRAKVQAQYTVIKQKRKKAGEFHL